MHIRNLRSHLMAGAARLLLTVEDDAPAAAAGGPTEPAAAAAAPEGDDPAPAGGADGAAPPEGAAPEGGADGGDPPPDPAPKRVPWQVKRIDQLTAQTKQAEEAAAAAREEARQANERAAAYEALYGRPEGEPAPAARPAAPAGERTYTQTELQAEAARIAAVNTLNQKCEGLFTTGAAAHKDSWNTRVQQAGQAFGAELQRRPDFFEALTALDNGADVYHDLTGDLDHLAEVLAMPAVQMGMELAKMSVKASAKPKGPAVSKVPAPIEPIDGAAGADDGDLSKVDMATYAKRREEQRVERAKARGY